MATVKLPLPILAATPAATNGAAHKTFAGTNFPIRCLAFDGGSTDEGAYWQFRLANYGSGNLTLKIMWYADNASSGDVVFGAQIAAITPNTDSTNIETKSFDSANTVTDSHLGTEALRLHETSITITNLNSCAADDFVVLFLYRDASDTGTDTLANDVLVVDAELSYSDT